MKTLRAFYDQRPTTPRSPKRPRPRSPRRRRASSESVAVANPYMLYYIDRFPVLKEQCDTVTAVASLVAQEWATLDESAKNEYRKQARATQSARKSLCFFEKEDDVTTKSRAIASKGGVTSQKADAEHAFTTKESLYGPMHASVSHAAPVEVATVSSREVNTSLTSSLEPEVSAELSTASREAEDLEQPQAGASPTESDESQASSSPIAADEPKSSVTSTPNIK